MTVYYHCYPIRGEWCDLEMIIDLYSISIQDHLFFFLSFISYHSVVDIIAWICICPSKSYVMCMLKEHFTDDLDLAD